MFGPVSGRIISIMRCLFSSRFPLCVRFSCHTPRPEKEWIPVRPSRLLDMDIVRFDEKIFDMNDFFMFLIRHCYRSFTEVWSILVYVVILFMPWISACILPDHLLRNMRPNQRLPTPTQANHIVY